MNNEFVCHICISTYEDNSMSKVNRHFTVSALHIVFVLDTPDVWIYNLYGKSSNARLRTELIGSHLRRVLRQPRISATEVSLSPIVCHSLAPRATWIHS